MDTELEQQIASRAAALPDAVKRAIATGGIPEKIAALGKKYSLHIDQLATLDTEVSLVMLGLIRPDKLDEAIITEVGLDKEKAYALVEDINKEILAPIRASLIALHDAQKYEESSPEGIDRESLLSGIENPSPIRSIAPAQQTPRVLTAPVAARPIAAPLLAQAKSGSPFSSSFTAAKLSGTFIPTTSSRPLAAPAIKTMPRTQEETMAIRPASISIGVSNTSKQVVPTPPVTPPRATLAVPQNNEQKPITPVAKAPTPEKSGLAAAINAAVPGLAAPSPKLQSVATPTTSSSVPGVLAPKPAPSIAPAPPSPIAKGVDPYREPIS